MIYLNLDLNVIERKKWNLMRLFEIMIFKIIKISLEKML